MFLQFHRAGGFARRLLVLVLFTGSLAPTIGEAASITGRVIDPDARPVPRARVLLSGPIGTAGAVDCDESGAFELRDVAAGHYELRALVDGFSADPITIDLATDDRREVEVRLRISAVAESVVVSAAQVEVPLTGAPGSVSVIGSSALRSRQIETVADALRLVPGLTIARTGGRGGITSLFPRGGESDFTLVVIDGMRANAFGGGYDLAQLPVSDVERIEVVRGPQSAVYGSDAIGAVVHIVTRHGGPPRAHALLEGGGQATSRAAAGFAGSAGAWSWSADAERFASDGFTGIAPATGERVGNEDVLTRHLSLGLGWRAPSGTEMRIDGRITTHERGFPGPFGSNPIGAFTGVDRVARGDNENRQAGWRLDHPWGGRVRQRAQIAFGDFDGNFTSAFGLSETETRRLSGRTQIDVALARNLGLSAGVEIHGEQARNTFITGEDASPIPVKRRVTGSFAEARFGRGPRLTLTGGLRIERIRRDPLEGDRSPFSPRPQFDTDRVVSANPKAGVSYILRGAETGRARLLAWTRLRASAGTGIRPPDAFEIAFTDNPRLKPERSRSAEVALAQALAGGAAVIEATVFYNRYDDLIVAVGRSLRDLSRFRTDNISNARSRGVELTASARTPWGLDARLGYTFLDTEILAVDRGHGQAPPPFTVGDPLIRRPRHQGSIGVGLVRGRLDAFGDATFRGRRLDVEPSFGASGGLFPAPGYAVINTGVTIRVSRHVDVFARATNLFDRQYEEAFGFPSLRRTANVGVRLAAGR